MGINRITIDGYAQIELNRVSWPITGRVIADLPLNASFNTTTPAENGMILAVNYQTGEVTLPTGTDAILGIHYSPEKEYDPTLSGLNQFYLVANNAVSPYQGRPQGFYPRLGIPAVGDRFTTDCLCYNTSTYTNNALALAGLANCATTPVYGFAHTTGAIEVTTNSPASEKLALQAISYTTMPDGGVGVKFVVIVAQ
jgi:hypothetical protein